MKLQVAKLMLLTIFIFVYSCIFSQTTFFGDEPVKWSSNKAPFISEEFKNETSDLVILEEKTEFYFYAVNNEQVLKNCVIKINTEKGLNILRSFTLPESFDNAYDAQLYKQGRRSKIKTPYIEAYHVLSFGARKFSKGHWNTLSFKVKYERQRWVRPPGKNVNNAGEFVNDELSVFQLQDIEVGDIIEIKYASEFSSAYGSNLFYLNGPYPKQHSEFDFIYKVNRAFAGFKFVLPMNLLDSAIVSSSQENGDYIIFTDKIRSKNLKGINYPSNSRESNTLPHIFADFIFYRVIADSYPYGGTRIYEYEVRRPKKFEWILFSDTTYSYSKIYDKQFASIHKFTSNLPPVGSDSANVVFFKAFCDTFNNLKFISSNHLFYNESNLYNIYSGENLLKHRLAEPTMIKLYKDILNDSKSVYYDVNIQDKRYGEHTIAYRTHYAYEGRLFAIPVKNSFIYFMPRYNGIKYHLNELPFYYEGALGALTLKNFQENTNPDIGQFKFIKTHKGTYNENTRTENATVKISLDSLKAGLATKESLSGQFSTVLRHLYLNDCIDSTIAPFYFKKCTDKPFASNPRIKFSSRISDFPFRYTFNCSEKITLQDSKSVSLKNWFSFILSKNTLPQTPTHDYYFDFDFSDSYNFLLDFGMPVEINNSNGFFKNITNEFFELKSEIVKNSDSNYLIKVNLVVKETKVPFGKTDLLMVLVKELDGLNDFTLSVNKK